MTTYPSVRRLPFRLEPVEGEALWSYLERLASFTNSDVFSVLRAVGLTKDVPKTTILSTYPIYLSDHFLTTFSKATRLDISIVEKMLLTSYKNKVVSARVVEDYVETLNRGRLSVLTLTNSQRSSLCPKCVQESQGAWKLEWMMPWSFACLKHKTLLQQYCPKCHQLLGPKNHYKKFAKVQEPFIPKPGFCNYLHQTNSSEYIKPCGYKFTQIQATCLKEWPALLESQTHLSLAMEGRSMPVAGDEVSSVEYLEVIKQLLTIVYRTISPEYIRGLPAELQSIYEDNTTNPQQSPLKVRNSKSPLAYYLNKAVMATVLPVATQIASVSSVEQFVLALKSLNDKIYDVECKSLRETYNFLEQKAFPDHFIDSASKMYTRKLNERIDRHGGFYYDFSQMSKVVNPGAKKINRKVILSPNLVEALQRQVLENNELTVPEHADLFEAQQGIRLKTGTLYSYIRRLGFQRNSSAGKGLWHKPQAQCDIPESV